MNRCILAGRPQFGESAPVKRDHQAVVIAGAVLLGGCSGDISASPSLAPGDAPLGYPVFLATHEGRCTYQVQDMIMGREQTIEWLAALQEKQVQIDLVLLSDTSEGCLGRIEQQVRRMGFAGVLVRSGDGLVYPAGGPP